MAQIAASGESRFHRLGFYSAALVPAIGSAAYGIARADLAALIVAILAFAFFTCWHIAREMKVAPLFQSLCAKLESFEREGDA